MEMTNLESVLSQMDKRFQRALMYFQDQRGQEIPWPSVAPDGSLPLLATKAKAIYKPNASLNSDGIALSVRQNLHSTYGDVDPIYRSDGTWVYLYHHEGSSFDDSYTNAALYRNLRLGRPVAVFRQVKEKPKSRYVVDGLALVVPYSDGYFYLEGFNKDGWARRDAVTTFIDSVRGADEAEGLPLELPQTDLDHDARVRIVQSIVRRQGQKKFRDGLLRQYESRCAISGSGVVHLLDAAHIRPYLGPHTNEITNGLLLRTDLHALFDLGFLAIDPITRKVRVANVLMATEYAEFNNRVIAEPQDSSQRPSDSNLQRHLEWCAETLERSSEKA